MKEAQIENNLPEPGEKIYNGKIIKVAKTGDNAGYGFLSSKEIPFTRIFFHWTGVRPDSTKFVDLKVGMKVSFVGQNQGDKGWKAIKIKVEE